MKPLSRLAPLGALAVLTLSVDACRRQQVETPGPRTSTSVDTSLREVIHFDFDEADLRGDARSRLDAKLPILLANPGVALRISGHADERGSDEYNLALGQRRAAAAKRYLTERGVADSRIETVSFGEEQPIAGGGDESAYAANRRAEFEVTGGGDRVARARAWSPPRGAGGPRSPPCWWG